LIGFLRIDRFVFKPVRYDHSLVRLDLCLAIIILEIGTDPRRVQFSSCNEALGHYRSSLVYILYQ
jgi:hypothetical protein